MIFHPPRLDTSSPIRLEILLFEQWFGLKQKDLNFLEYRQYHFRDRIERNSRFQPNRRCRFYGLSIGRGIIGLFCSFGRIYLNNLYGKNRYNNQ